MLGPKLRISLLKNALVIGATAGICAAILLAMRSPEVKDGRELPAEHAVLLLSANLGGAHGIAPSSAEGGEIVLAKSAKTNVPLPEKQNPVPPPVRKGEAESGESETKTVSASAPEAAAATASIKPVPEGRLSKADSDKALAALLSYEPPAADIGILKDFVKLVYKEDYDGARPMLDSIGDPTVKKFALWYYYRAKAPGAEASEIAAFLNENPFWPDRAKLRAAVEDALFWREEDPRKVADYFAGRRPESGVGLAALGSALIGMGRANEGEAMLRQAWRKHVLTPAIEKKIRKLHKLSHEDHRARAAYLLMQDKKEHLAAVKRILPMIDKDERLAVKARIATVERSKRAGGLLSALDGKAKADPGVMFSRIQWLRRADKDKEVWSLLKSAPGSPEKLIDPAAWWDERQIQIRLALNTGSPKTAYELAKGHERGLDHWDLSDASFLAGWIALRFLDMPKEARAHFLASSAAGGLPKSRARAGYWLGRTELALKNEREAVARFAEAAQHNHTFYGQLAQQMIAATGAKLNMRTFVKPNETEAREFASRDAIKAIVITKKAEFDSLMAVFLFDLARTLQSAPDMILLNELALRVAPRHIAVRAAKIAMNRDFPVEYYAYPDALPEFKALAESEEIENALIHALTRQESEFNPQIVSSAGAVGLMQLLPSTAKMVAGWHSMKFEKQKLSADPAYNVSLGTAFLHRLISNYDGSYIMALAGYNAGPGRIREWVDQFGDPRKKEIDPIDWIERIPFTETREYVHKILESAQVYRSRLHGDGAPLLLAEDLHRGRKDRPLFLNGAAAN
jgi:soluble lytic murein transglycosylase